MSDKCVLRARSVALLRHRAGFCESRIPEFIAQSKSGSELAFRDSAPMEGVQR
jgi:hypothetical protein